MVNERARGGITVGSICNKVGLGLGACRGGPSRLNGLEPDVSITRWNVRWTETCGGDPSNRSYFIPKPSIALTNPTNTQTLRREEETDNPL